MVISDPLQNTKSQLSDRVYSSFFVVAVEAVPVSPFTCVKYVFKPSRYYNLMLPLIDIAKHSDTFCRPNIVFLT